MLGLVDINLSGKTQLEKKIPKSDEVERTSVLAHKPMKTGAVKHVLSSRNIGRSYVIYVIWSLFMVFIQGNPELCPFSKKLFN